MPGNTRTPDDVIIPTPEEKLRPFFEKPGGTMKAAVLRAANDLALCEVPRPAPVEPGTVVVRAR
jgi:hypothetical protein